MSTSEEEAPQKTKAPDWSAFTAELSELSLEPIQIISEDSGTAIDIDVYAVDSPVSADTASRPSVQTALPTPAPADIASASQTAAQHAPVSTPLPQTAKNAAAETRHAHASTSKHADSHADRQERRTRHASSRKTQEAAQARKNRRSSHAAPHVDDSWLSAWWERITSSIFSAQEHEATDAAAEAEFSFVQEAHRRAFWNRPQVRLALITASVIAGFTLAGQWLFHERAAIYAQVPLSRLLFDAVCKKPGCQIPTWQNIGAIGIDNSNLLQIADHSYQLDITLNNSSIHPVAMPALELLLLNDDGQVIARRVLFTQKDLAAPNILPPRTEWSGSVKMDVHLPAHTPTQEIAGFRLAVFYP